MADDYLSFAGGTFYLNETTTKMSSNNKAILRDIVLEMKDVLINVTFKLWDNMLVYHVSVTFIGLGLPWLALRLVYSYCCWLASWRQVL